MLNRPRVKTIATPAEIRRYRRRHVRKERFEEAGFRITHRSIHDYRPTLRAWFDNLVRRRDEALKLVDVHTYNRFLTFFPASWRYFQDNIGMVTRWILEKPGRS